jgi:hypothetical protein
MPSFVLNQPIETTTPEIEVTVLRNELPPGRHTFQLVVVDDSGNASTPTVTEVIVRDNAKPTAVLDAPAAVDVGKSFVLSGKRSSDVGGAIVKYIWTRLT